MQSGYLGVGDPDSAMDENMDRPSTPLLRVQAADGPSSLPTPHTHLQYKAGLVRGVGSDPG